MPVRPSPLLDVNEYLLIEKKKALKPERHYQISFGNENLVWQLGPKSGMRKNNLDFEHWALTVGIVSLIYRKALELNYLLQKIPTGFLLHLIHKLLGLKTL